MLKSEHFVGRRRRQPWRPTLAGVLVFLFLLPWIVGALAAVVLTARYFLTRS